MKRRYAYDVNDKASSHELLNIKTDFLEGIVCCLKLNELVTPLVVNNGVEEVTIRAPYYQMIEFYPKNDNYVLTIMFDDKSNLIEWYFDISKEVGIDNGIPYEDDLYLDYIITNEGKELVVDEDELKQALLNNDITEEDYNNAYKMLDYLKDKFYGNLDQLKNFTSDIYSKFNDNVNKEIIEIRKAKPEEAEQIIDINREVWNTTYKDLIPQEIIDKLQTKNDARIEKNQKSIREKQNTFVALVYGKIVGFNTFGKSRDENYENSGEIYAGYILDDYQGLGLGRKMAIECMKELLKNGFKTLVTKCLDGNPSNNFHKSLGGIYVGQSNFEPLGIYVGKENVYFHEDLSKSLEYNIEKINNKQGIGNKYN